MRELLVYGVSGLAAVFIFGYSVHMFVGGLVSARTEIMLIIAVVLLAALGIGYLLWNALSNRH